MKKHKRKTPVSSILFMSLSALVGAFSQATYKYMMNSLQGSMVNVLISPLLYAGLTLYGVATLLMVLSLRKGELSVLFPFRATTFVWVAIFSFFLFGEPFPLLKTLGILVIISALVFIGFGGES